MASLRIWSFLTTLVLILAIQLPLSVGIGVNYGRNGDNLPPPQNVVSLYKRCAINMVRLFEPNPIVLEALRGSNLQVSLGVRNGDVQSLASSQEAANQWVTTNVAPYKNDVSFQWITLGNEIIPSDQATFVAQAMNNIKIAINSIGLSDTKVTTSIYMAAIANTYPPSAATFTDDAMKDVVAFLEQNGAPLMANVYPYFAYSSNPTDIKLDYAIFQASDPVVDGDLKYFNLFDAMVDSIYASLEKIGGANVPLIIGETGWPTAGNEPYTSLQNAETYNKNLIGHVQNGTPRRPGQALNTFIYAMFNEDEKQVGVEQNWGLFYPNMTSVYPLLSC